MFKELKESVATIDEQIEILNKDTENTFKVPSGNSVAEIAITVKIPKGLNCRFERAERIGELQINKLPNLRNREKKTEVKYTELQKPVP